MGGLCRGKVPAGDDIVNVEGFKADEVIDPLLFLRQGRVGSLHRLWNRTVQDSEIWKLTLDILHRLHKLCTVLDQAVRPCTRRARDVPRDGEDLTPLFQGEASGDQSAASLGGLDHDHATGEAGDGAVALWEGPFGRVVSSGYSLNTVPL